MKNSRIKVGDMCEIRPFGFTKKMVVKVKKHICNDMFIGETKKANEYIAFREKHVVAVFKNF